MDVKLTKVVGIGKIESERVIIKALVDIDIGRYGIYKTGVNTRQDKKVINSIIYKAYWFPDKLIKTNDLVVLYTKAGVSSELHNQNGTTTHFFYWGLPTPLWMGVNGTVLVHTPDWESLI